MGQYSDYVNSIPEDPKRSQRESKVVKSKQDVEREIAKMPSNTTFLEVQGGIRPGLLGSQSYEIRIKGSAIRSHEELEQWCHYLNQVISDVINKAGGNVKTIWVKPDDPPKEEK